MKKISFMKKTLLQVTFVTTILIFASCGSNQRLEDTKDVAQEHNDAKFDNNKQEKDARFLVSAAEINLEQIQLGKLAQQIGRSSYVRELGNNIEDSHTKSFNDLTELAKNKLITIPTSSTDNAQDSYKKLNNKSGSAFDEAFADKMVSNQKDAISVFEEASKDRYDKDIKNWASNALPSLRKNLDNSIDCQKRCNKN